MEIIVVMFVQGVLSFFSPCILSLIPIYMGYLTSDAKSVDEEGNVSYKKSKVLLTTFFFVLGISMVFFLAGLSASALRNWFFDYQIIFSIIGGFLLLLLGLFHLGIISIPQFHQEHRLQMKKVQSMSLFKAFALGFFFSFAWSPCVGPLLTNALVLAANAKSAWIGNSYIFAYALGFISSFMLLGIFTEEILSFFKKKPKIINTIVKIGGILVLIMGMWMLQGAFQKILVLQDAVVQNGVDPNHIIEECDDPTHNHYVDNGESENLLDIEKYDFTLEDQNGTLHTLSEYKGKPIVMTFFATWCTYCKDQIEGLKALQESEEAQVLIITVPNYNNEGSKEELIQYIKDNDLQNLTFLFDDTTVLRMYQVTGYPTSYIYTSEGDLFGTLPGAVEESYLFELIEQAK